MKRKTRLLWIGGGTLLIASLGFGIWSWANQSSKGTVHIGTYTPDTTANETPINISSPYFSTTLPAGFVVKHQSEVPTQTIAFTLMATTSATIDEQFATTVGAMPSGGIQENGDYNLRVTEPSIYERAAIEQLPSGATAFRKLSRPAELTIFWPHNNRYAELSCSSSGSAAYSKLEALCVSVINAWEWR